MSDLPIALHALNAKCQAWNLMSGLPTSLHTLNARCQGWNLMSGLPTASMHGMSGVKPGI